MHTVHGKKLFMKFHRDQSLVCFYFPEDVAVASYADNTTPYNVSKTNDLVMKEIEHFSEVLFKWFDFNYMKTNSLKSHMLLSGNYSVSANIDDHNIISEEWATRYLMITWKKVKNVMY